MASSGKTVFVAAALCIVCSVLVSTTAVKLKPRQLKNAELDMKKNILAAAKLYKEGADVDALYSENIEEKVLDLSSGRIAEMEASNFDSSKVEMVKPENDFAGLGSIASKKIVYVIKDGGIILPIKSQGLWNLMYGFLALENDTRTVIGFQYYQQGETPGLGAEVDNPKWRAQWPGKKVTNEDYEPKIELVKSKAPEGSDERKYQIDALSGATITTNGVRNSIHFWLTEGYGKFLENFRKGEI